MRTKKSHRRFLAAVGAVLLVGATAATASADQGGTPNVNSCVGQAMAFEAHGGSRTGNGVWVRELARNDIGPGRAAELQVFLAGEDGCRQD